MNANQEIIAELRRVLGERDAAREQLDLTKRELGRWVDREAQAVRECDELRAQRGLALGRLENAIQLANQYAKERDQEREACAMYAERSGRFAEQADRLQRERDLALERLENEIKAANQARMAEERARESLDELDAAIYECLPSDYDDDSPLDCVEHAADRLRELAKERDEARAEVDGMRSQIERLRGVLHIVSLDEYESTSSAAEKVHAHARQARVVLNETLAEVTPSDAAHVASLENLFLKACKRAEKWETASKDACRRGAEAMREACAAALMADGLVLSRERAANVVRALPIPEEP